MLNPGGGWGGVEVLGVKMLWTAEITDNFFTPPPLPVEGARAKMGNQPVRHKLIPFSTCDSRHSPRDMPTNEATRWKRTADYTGTFT